MSFEVFLYFTPICDILLNSPGCLQTVIYAFCLSGSVYMETAKKLVNPKKIAHDSGIFVKPAQMLTVTSAVIQ